ncbi:MAG: PQQ-binding-like beta-propeller repeat protein [Candidatus Puniceispirillaceae bacterium]
MKLFMVKPFFAVLVLTALGACSDPELILPGERTAILPEKQIIQINDDALAEGARLGNAMVNETYGHAGMTSGHDGGHLSLSWPVSLRWSASVEGVDDTTVELAAPVIAHDQLYALGADGQLHAFAVADGAKKWAVFVEALSDDPWAGIAGGIAANETQLVAHASNYKLVSLSPQTGEELWSVTHSERLKGGPTLLSDEAVMVTDINGRLYVYDMQGGNPLWERSGLRSNTVVFGAPAPAFAGDEVVLAGAGGEVSVYDAASGDLLWADSLASFNPRTPLQELGDVRAHPVHDGKLIFVIAQSGRMVAYQAVTGIDIWEKPLTAIEMPWLAGETIYTMTIDGRLYALRRSDGAARWMAELPGALEIGEIASETVPRYANPIVASGNVFVIGRGGNVHIFDANTGAAIQQFSTPGPVTTAPVVAQESLVILNSKGKLRLYR